MGRRRNRNRNKGQGPRWTPVIEEKKGQETIPKEKTQEKKVVDNDREILLAQIALLKVKIIRLIIKYYVDVQFIIILNTLFVCYVILESTHNA